MVSSVSMDYFESALNPCSVESIPEPVTVASSSSSDGSNPTAATTTGRRIWPVMVSSYELQESTGKRHGSMDVYAVQVPDMSNHKSLQASMVLRFGKPLKALSLEESQESGILDGKWIRAPNYHHHNNENSNTSKNIDHSQPHHQDAFYFASARSTGDIQLHSCVVKNQEDFPSASLDPESEESPLHMELVGRSERLAPLDGSHDRSPLCLSLHWDADSFHESSRIVSSYSDGRVAIHDVSVKQPISTTIGGSHSLQLSERVSWEAHTMFTSPAEVWSAAFVGGHRDTNMVMSGGDEGNLKLWDIRNTNRPTQVLKHFEAGVTVVAPHPRQPNLVACGSYDETICLYDIRYLSPQKPLGRSAPLGGGIWRIKWHPIDDCQMLVAAMHGGCRIVQIDNLENDNTPVMTATKEFTEHKSMAYGVDWLVCDHPTQAGYFEAAASCSFYDNAVHMWDTVA